MLRQWTLTFVLILFQTSAFSAPLMGTKMMVATPSSLSAQVAEKIIAKKGNVVDVAVTIALVLSVTNPRHASLGGGGFAMVKMGKDPVKALDFREVAPLATNKDYYKDKAKDASRVGAHAIGVPGIPAGLWALHKKYGKIHWSQLFDDAIKLARKGHRVTGENAQRMLSVKDQFNNAGKKYFLKKGNKAYKPGELLRQKQLAKALKLIRNRGVVAFYEGDIGRDIADTIKKEGGALTRKDLLNYKVRWYDPITTTFQGHKLYLMPPPSSGGLIIASSLKMLEELKATKLQPLSTLEFHYLAEVMKINFRNRNLLGDPAFTKNPTDEFLSPSKIKGWVSKIKPDKVLNLTPINTAQFKESPQTTHLTVMDVDGNAVSMTLTLNNVFGSKVVSNKYGIALNNEMDDFTTHPGESNSFQLTQGNSNFVEPGKRPLSSMSPTLVEKNGKITMALGAPGGPRIITGVMQTLYRSIVNKYNMEEAIHAPRVHHQFLPNTLFMDDKRFAPLSIKALQEIGHKTKKSWHSIVNGVRINKDGYLEAAFDNRAEGAAGGY